MSTINIKVSAAKCASFLLVQTSDRTLDVSAFRTFDVYFCFLRF